MQGLLDSERHARGVLLVLASAAFFAMSGIFTKAIAQDTWTILGWRGLVGGGLVTAYVILLQRRRGQVLDLRLGREGCLIAAASALAAILFIASFKMTSVANVVVIYATVPFVAAAITWLWRRERLARRTMIAAVVCMSGVLVTVFGSVGAGNLAGDMVAIAFTVLCALYLVMIRMFPEAPSVWASAAASFLLVVPAILFRNQVPIGWNDAVLMTLFGACFAAAIVTWTEGARLIPSAEAGMLGTAEIPVAALVAAFLLAEYPTSGGLAGGAIVVAAVIWHAAPTVLKRATA
jgi:drug/metabolite transporter (DMT)-like permease